MVKLLKSAKYLITHVPLYSMELKNINLQFITYCIGYLPIAIIVVAIGLGVYARWAIHEGMSIPLFAMFGIFIIGISCALRFYFSFEEIGKLLMHLWLGYSLGMLTFTEILKLHEAVHVSPMIEAMNILMLTSVGLEYLWNVRERILHKVIYESTLLKREEIMESLGFMIGGLIVPGFQWISIALLVLAFCFIIISIRVKTFLGLVNFIAWTTILSTTLFPLLNVSVNFYVFWSYVGRQIFQPVIDMYFCGHTSIERWQPFLSSRRLLRRGVVAAIFLLNIAYVSLVGYQLKDHKEWFVVIPIYGVFLVIWLCFHLIYFISCWKLMNKISDCNSSYENAYGEEEGSRSIARIMASRGVRHFCLICQRMICVTLLTTVIIIGIGWTTHTSYSIGLVLVILAIESLTLSLFWGFGTSLGGTCNAYALVVPATSASSTSSRIHLLSPGSIQEIGERATHILHLALKMFSHHMFDIFGCDYSSSGLSLDNIETKLKTFFDKCTADGPHYDTYLFYYSGDVRENGDIALTDNQSLKFETILEWWTAKAENRECRLIMVFDTLHSYHLLKPVSRYKDGYVALQTCQYLRPADPETGDGPKIGDFTQDWVDCNITSETNFDWDQNKHKIKPDFAFSKYWSDFQFRLPTQDEVTEHWSTNFPLYVRPLIKAVNYLNPGPLFCCCSSIARDYRRCRIMWFVPKELDSGHGFKLYRC